MGFGVSEYLNESIDLAEWCNGVSYMMVGDDEKAYSDAPVVGPHIIIPTLEGAMAALPGDWVIKGVAGEFYSCKPDIFELTYEPVVTEERIHAVRSGYEEVE